MPDDNENADLEFYNKLTDETFRTNENLKKYYDTIESLYNGNSIFLNGQDAENEAHEVLHVTRHDQDAHSGDSFQNNGAEMFISKFSTALGKLLYQHDDSFLLQHDNTNSCVYFKYWFYDKILKNILSDQNLTVFYNDMQSGDEDDEDRDGKFVKENKEDEPVEEYIDGEEEEEEDIVDGRLLKVEDDSDESEDVENVKNQYRLGDEDYDGNNILLSLGNSNNCNIYKLKLNQIINIKLLYDYFENYDDKTKRTNVEKQIIKNRYCDSFNNLIELYNKKIECKSDESDNEYCHELEECRKSYSHTNIPKLRCTVAESAPDPPEQDASINPFQVRSQLPLQGRGTGSDSTRFGGLLDAETKSSKASMGTEEMGSTAQHKDHTIDEKQTSPNVENFAESGQAHSQVSFSEPMKGSLSMDFKPSTSCSHGSADKSCINLLQPIKPVSSETGNHLNELPQGKEDMYIEPDVSLQEENGNTNTIVSSASSVLGISALAFMLYKFTPLGSLINNRRGGMDTWDINEEGYDENLFSSALGNTNSNNNNYSIGYYSLGNT
ncbi:PIR Superfamily Protein [Plasmodium ovale curtisi]|uniref:PIR Superfamily Protein n=1 Tax=Plasmodium ovale curtisi TaxID=864141 RepID=A0A1A8X8T6_PLAOA|nr:PIR Superfamily Protein [Plasmodium ovale curtisi]